MQDNNKRFFASLLVFSIIVSSLFGAGAGFLAGSMSASGVSLRGALGDILAGKNGREKAIFGTTTERTVTSQNDAIVQAVEKVSPAVVSIIVTKDLPKFEQQMPFNSDFFRQFFGSSFDSLFPDSSQGRNGGGDGQKTEIGGGSGFIVSDDGYVVTNKHVTADQSADYTVLMNDGTKYPAKVLARDSVNDVSVLKITADKKLPTVELGDSSNLKVGQSVIAIGNALGEFRNTVSTGVISGLARSITAGGGLGTQSEELVNVIQTDASINPGNSGGPLLNLDGQVIGINTAVVIGAQNIGFALPINEVKSSIESVKKTGRIIRPWLGLRYVQLNKAIAEENNLSVDYGALVLRGERRTELAVIPGSPADKAGLLENDIILEVDGKKIEKINLAQLISGYKVGDEVNLKILRKGETREIKVKLEEMK